GLATVGAGPGERAELSRPETLSGPPRTPRPPGRGWTHAPRRRWPGPEPRPLPSAHARLAGPAMNTRIPPALRAPGPERYGSLRPAPAAAVLSDEQMSVGFPS